MKCFLHGWNKVDSLHLRERSFNAPLLSEIGKHLYTERHMPTPTIASPNCLLFADAIFL